MLWRPWHPSATLRDDSPVEDRLLRVSRSVFVLVSTWAAKRMRHALAAYLTPCAYEGCCLHWSCWTIRAKRAAALCGAAGLISWRLWYLGVVWVRAKY